MTVLPEPPEPHPLVGTAVLFGALVGYGAFAVLISLVAGFANGAHANQVLSAATWGQLGTGGGIVTAIVLFVAWAAGGFVAARLAGHDGLRHGIWTFVLGVVLMTVVAAAITWMPDTETILRNLRLLGVPVRRAEWRDAVSVAGIGSLVGMALGAALGGRYAERRPAISTAVAPAVPAPRPVGVETAPLPVAQVAEQEPEPFFVADATTSEDLAETVGAPAEEAAALSYAGASTSAPAEDPPPAWWSPDPIPEPASTAPTEPAPAPVEPERVEPEPVEAEPVEPEPVEPQRVEAEPVEAASAPGSWWPDPAAAPAAAPEPAPSYDDAWALPDDEPAQAVADSEFAFPPPAPVGSEPAVEMETAPEPAPLGEHADWSHDRGAFQTPPEPGDDEHLQHEPATLFEELDESREEEIRRRQREDAARAYRRIIEDK